MKPLFSLLAFALVLSACLPSDPYTLRAAADSMIEATHAAQTVTAEAVVRENQAVVLAQMQTQTANDNLATSTAQTFQMAATGTALYFEAQSTQAAATAQAIATQEAQTIQATRQAFALAELQQGATATSSYVSTQTALEYSRQTAALAREKVITVAGWVALFVFTIIVLILGWQFVQWGMRTQTAKRSWVEGAEAFGFDHGHGLTIVTPRRMFSPAMQLDARGQATMPQLTAPDLQAHTTWGALLVEMEREKSKKPTWFTPVGKSGRGESFTPLPDAEAPLQLPAPQLSPLPMLSGRHILIAGATGTGKTHTARYLLRARQDEQVQILDPHFKPGEWPGEFDILGGGRDFDAIEAAIGMAYEMMTLRFQQRKKGAGHFEPLTLVVDEIPAITKYKPEAAAHLQALANEGRKIAIYLMLLSQSVLVKPLGLEGAGDLRANFATVRLNPLPEGTPEAAPRTVTLIIGDLHKPESEEKYLVPNLPGLVPEAMPLVPNLVPGRLGTTAEPGGTWFPDENTPAEPGSQAETALVKQLHAQGYGLGKIASLLGGRRKDTLERIRAILGRV